MDLLLERYSAPHPSLTAAGGSSSSASTAKPTVNPLSIRKPMPYLGTSNERQHELFDDSITAAAPPPPVPTTHSAALEEEDEEDLPMDEEDYEDEEYDEEEGEEDQQGGVPQHSQQQQLQQLPKPLQQFPSTVNNGPQPYNASSSSVMNSNENSTSTSSRSKAITPAAASSSQAALSSSGNALQLPSLQPSGTTVNNNRSSAATSQQQQQQQLNAISTSSSRSQTTPRGITSSGVSTAGKVAAAPRGTTGEPASPALPLQSNSATTNKDNNSSKDNTKEKRKKKKVPTKKVLNVCFTKYPVIREVAEEQGFTMDSTDEELEKNDANLIWSDTVLPLTKLVKLLNWQRSNHFPSMHLLCRKGHLGLTLGRMRKHFPTHYSFFPRTWSMRSEKGQFARMFAELQGVRKVFILKPNAGCQGRGIVLSKDPLNAVEDLDNYVVQEYVSRPLLIERKKFDLRVYCLITSIRHLSILLFNDGLVRMCAEDYEKPNDENMSNSCKHLTNYAVNKHSEQFVFNSDREGRGDTGNKRDFRWFNSWLEQMGHSSDKFWDKVQHMIVKTILAAQPQMLRVYNSCFPHNNDGFTCFEVLGFDILVDDRVRPVLMEVNHTPSLTCDTPLDHRIKHSLVTETWSIINIQPTDKQKHLEREKRQFTKRMQAAVQNKLMMLRPNNGRGGGDNADGGGGDDRATAPPARAVQHLDSFLNTNTTNSLAGGGSGGSEPSQLLAEFVPDSTEQIAFEKRVQEDQRLVNYRRIYPTTNIARQALYETILATAKAATAVQTTASQEQRQQEAKIEREKREREKQGLFPSGGTGGSKAGGARAAGVPPRTTSASRSVRADQQSETTAHHRFPPPPAPPRPHSAASSNFSNGEDDDDDAMMMMSSSGAANSLTVTPTPPSLARSQPSTMQQQQQQQYSSSGATPRSRFASPSAASSHPATFAAPSSTSSSQATLARSNATNSAPLPLPPPSGSPTVDDLANGQSSRRKKETAEKQRAKLAEQMERHRRRMVLGPRLSVFQLREVQLATLYQRDGDGGEEGEGGGGVLVGGDATGEGGSSMQQQQQHGAVPPSLSSAAGPTPQQGGEGAAYPHPSHTFAQPQRSNNSSSTVSPPAQQSLLAPLPPPPPAPSVAAPPAAAAAAAVPLTHEQQFQAILQQLNRYQQQQNTLASLASNPSGKPSAAVSAQSVAALLAGGASTSTVHLNHKQLQNPITTTTTTTVAGSIGTPSPLGSEPIPLTWADYSGPAMMQPPTQPYGAAFKGRGISPPPPQQQANSASHQSSHHHHPQNIIRTQPTQLLQMHEQRNASSQGGLPLGHPSSGGGNLRPAGHHLKHASSSSSPQQHRLSFQPHTHHHHHTSSLSGPAAGGGGGSGPASVRRQSRPLRPGESPTELGMNGQEFQLQGTSSVALVQASVAHHVKQQQHHEGNKNDNNNNNNASMAAAVAKHRHQQEQQLLRREEAEVRERMQTLEQHLKEQEQDDLQDGEDGGYDELYEEEEE